jgi:hypothetical protein
MLELLRRNTKDRIVIVSNYTSTLDVVTKLCTECRYPCAYISTNLPICPSAYVSAHLPICYAASADTLALCAHTHASCLLSLENRRGDGRAS